MGVQEAVKAGCHNKAYPDKYGHFREAHRVTIKHHWWWKLSQVFDNVRGMGAGVRWSILRTLEEMRTWGTLYTHSGRTQMQQIILACFLLLDEDPGRA